MPRQAVDTKMASRTARRELPARHAPYWRLIQEGHYIGYRKGKANKAGTWIAKRYDPTAEKPKLAQTLGTADDFLDADGETTLTFAQAQERARLWFAELAAPPPTPEEVTAAFTVKDAMEEYIARYKSRTKATAESQADFQRRVDYHILPKLGHLKVSELTTATLDKWLHAVADAPPRVRAKLNHDPGKPLPSRVRPADKSSRKATANRVYNDLKAALNLAFVQGKCESDSAWRRVKRLPDANEPKVRWLEDDEAVQLVQSCADEFRPIVTAALLTGCDYGELSSAKVSQVDLKGKTLKVAGKRGGRTVWLSPEAIAFFTAQTKDRDKTEVLFSRASGEPWGKSHAHRPIKAACQVANIKPAISFHILRHTYATRMLRRGMSMHQVSKQLGHKSTVMTQKHYAHVIPSDVADAVDSLSGELGLVVAA